MNLLEGLADGMTMAEAQGMTEELGRAVARLASHELAAGRTSAARAMLEGLAVTNPCDPAPWAMLALLHRRAGRQLAATACAAAASRLAPDDPQIRLVRAEVALASLGGAEGARSELASLSSEPGEVGARARALATALGVKA